MTFIFGFVELVSRVDQNNFLKRNA